MVRATRAKYPVAMATRCRPARSTSWVAIAAILLNSLLPAASQALAPARAPLQDICSVGDIGRIVSKTDEIPATGPHSVSFEHCPYCAPHAASFALPGHPSIAAAVPSGADAPAAFALPAQRTRSAWGIAHPRAPPAIH
jgi:hypothetical protein